MKPKHGDLRVWWIPQVPMKAFYVPVKDINEALLLIETLANYDIFQFENNIKPDYCNTGGLEMYEKDFDGDGNDGWCEWSNDDGYCISDLPRG